MNRTLLALETAHAFTGPASGSRRRIGRLRRWFARLVAARERKAAGEVLHRVNGLIPHARRAYRADLEALADRLRPDLR